MRATRFSARARSPRRSGTKPLTRARARALCLSLSLSQRYDAFGAGHSTTSISAAQGMSIGKELLRKARNNCVAVIGDGAITGGMAYEAMNCANYLNTRMFVVLNDNGQVSLPTGTPSAGGTKPAGELSAYTSRLLTSKPFKDFRDVAKQARERTCALARARRR